MYISSVEIWVRAFVMFNTDSLSKIAVKSFKVVGTTKFEEGLSSKNPLEQLEAKATDNMTSVFIVNFFIQNILEVKLDTERH